MTVVERTFYYPTRRTPPTQARFVRSRKRVKALVAGYGAGKTHGGSVCAVDLAYLNPGHLGLAIEPTVRQCRDAMLPALKKVCRELGVPIKVTHPFGAFDVTFLDTGFVWMLRGADRPDTIAGPTVACGWADEAELLKDEVWRNFKSRIREESAPFNQTLVTTTPKGFGFAWSTFDPTQNPDPDYALFQCSTHENAANLPEYFIRDMLATYDERTAQAYVEGKFVNLTAGTVWGDLFDNRVHVLPGFPADPARELIWVLDFNVDPMCASAWQEQPDGTSVCVDDLVVRNTHTLAFADEMLRAYPWQTRRDADGTMRVGFPKQRVYCDFSGKARQTSGGGKTDVRLLEERGWRVDYRQVLNERDPINSVRRMLRPAQGRTTMFFSDRARHAITSTQIWSYKAGGTGETQEKEYHGKPKTFFVPHMADTVKLFAHNRHAIDRPTWEVQG